MPEAFACGLSREAGGLYTSRVLVKPPYLFQLYHRSVHGGGDSGGYVFCGNEPSAFSLCAVSGGIGGIYGSDSHIWSLYWLRGGSLSDSDGQSGPGAGIYRAVSGASAD